MGSLEFNNETLKKLILSCINMDARDMREKLIAKCQKKNTQNLVISVAWRGVSDSSSPDYIYIMR